MTLLAMLMEEADPVLTVADLFLVAIDRTPLHHGGSVNLVLEVVNKVIIVIGLGYGRLGLGSGRPGCCCDRLVLAVEDQVFALAE